tara:strand:+ start:17680 stop:20139 length:2460 start_codon:yes stop_codon:yes gene_type:complete
MSDLKLNSTIGGNTIWSAGNLPVLPDGDSLFYEGHKVYTEFDKPTQADVGLSNVLNYGVADQTQAITGTSNSLYMTPLRVSDHFTSKTTNFSRLLLTDNTDSAMRTRLGVYSKTETDDKYALDTRTITAGDGLNGGGSLEANRTISIDSTVLRTSGEQTVNNGMNFDVTQGSVKINNPLNGSQSFDGTDYGLELLMGGANTTSKYTPAIKFGSTDNDLSPLVPRFGAAVIGEAEQTFSSNNTGAMSISFWTTPTGTSSGEHGLEKRLKIASSGEILALSGSFFSGNGSGLTDLSVDNLVGTVSYSNLPFSNTNVNQWITAYDGRIVGVSGSGNGTLILDRLNYGDLTTDLSHTHDASDIVSGTIVSNRLPTITTSMTNFANQSLNTSSNVDFDNITLGGDNRTGKNSDTIELVGGTSSALLSVQDGNGRIQLKWNATNGNDETYLVSSEQAFFWDLGVTGDPIWEMKYGSGGNSGSAISWDTLLSLTSSGELIANSFNGNGSGITNLQASNISGTISNNNLSNNSIPFNATDLESTNLNNLNTDSSVGFYFQNENADTNSSYPYGHAGSLLVQKSAGVTQQYQTYGTTPRWFMRGYYSGNWGDWYEMYHTGNKPKPSEIGAISTSGGAITGTLEFDVSGSDSAHQQMDSRSEDGDKARLHIYGRTSSGSTSNFRQAWYDGSDYIKVTAASGGLFFTDRINATSFKISSDTRLKDEQTDLTVNDGIRLKSWYWSNSEYVAKSIREKYDTGIIAQDVQKYYPTCVSEDKETGYLSVDYGRLGVHHSIELKETVEQLTKRIEELENRSLIKTLINKIKRVFK